jgi:Fur family ferric uptake transcriptional regulator
MTTHHDIEEELRGLLHEQKMRVTGVRLAVLSTLHEHQGPMTHEQIMDALSSDEYDRASVWRLLSDLADKGLLRRMDLGDRVWRYELVDACRSIDASHAHFLCGQCGDVACLPPLEIRTRGGDLPGVLSRAEFTIRIEGTCGTCLSA